MTKLTIKMRETIVNKIVEAGRIGREAWLERREHALALRCVKARFGDDVFERCRALPPGWINLEFTL